MEVDFAGTLGEDHNVAAGTVRRYAAETWMERNNVTTVTRDGEVLPDCCRYWIHYGVDVTWIKTMFDLLDEVERLRAEVRFLRNR